MSNHFTTALLIYCDKEPRFFYSKIQLDLLSVVICYFLKLKSGKLGNGEHPDFGVFYVQGKSGLLTV